MEKPPTLAVSQPEDFSPLKAETASSFLDDGTQPTRYLPTYPSLQPTHSAATPSGNDEQIAYANAPLPEYYNETSLAGSLPLGTDGPRPTPFIEEQAMSAAVVSSAPFGDTMTLHRVANELDGGASQYNMAPSYGGRTPAMVDSGPARTMAYQDSQYDPMVSNAMIRPSHKRGPFKNDRDREGTAHTRKIGSCVRCRMQRIRVRVPALKLAESLCVPIQPGVGWRGRSALFLTQGTICRSDLERRANVLSCSVISTQMNLGAPA